jgi:hypothetical protein
MERERGREGEYLGSGAGVNEWADDCPGEAEHGIGVDDVNTPQPLWVV